MSEVKITSVFSSIPVVLERAEDLADGLVDLDDHVAVEAPAGLARELVGDEERDVRHVRGEVEEERPVLVAADERHGPLGVRRGQPALVFGGDVGVDDAIALEERQGGIGRGRLGMARPHVVGVGEAEVLVEPVVGRELRRPAAEVPLAGHAGGVALPLEQFGERRLVVVEPGAILRPECAADADPLG